MVARVIRVPEARSVVKSQLPLFVTWLAHTANEDSGAKCGGKEAVISVSFGEKHAKWR